MRTRVILVAGLILLLLIAAGVYKLSGIGENRGPPGREPDAGAGGRKPEEHEEVLVADADPAADGPADGGPGEESGPSAEGVGGTASEAETPLGPPAIDIDSLPPAVRPNPRSPPPPRPGSGSMGPGARPPMGPTGLWEKFPPAVPRGRAILEVRVIDRDGTPVEGATVYIGPPEHAGSKAVSFGDLRQIGKTDRKGVVRAERLPEGAASVAVNLDNLLNGPRGLDMRNAVKVALLPEEVAFAEVRLPFLLSEFGAIRGVVLAADGAPLSRATVLTGFHRVYTDAAGVFSFPRLSAGQARVSAQKSGYEQKSVIVAVEAGRTGDLEFRLGYRETGSLLLDGRVLGPEGEAVPDARVYLIAKSGRGGGTVRTVKTDEAGEFRMEDLPDRLEETHVRIQASREGYRAGNTVFADGLKTSEVDVRMPARLVKLKLVVRDGKSGEPQDRCRFEATQEGFDRPAASFSSRSENGVYDRTWLAPGKYAFLIETPEHEPHRAAVEVAAGADVEEYVAEMMPTGETAREVILTVMVSSATTGVALERASIQILPPRGGAAIAGIHAERPGGEFVLPVPSGRWILRASAPGHQMREETVEIAETDPTALVEVALYPE